MTAPVAHDGYGRVAWRLVKWVVLPPMALALSCLLLPLLTGHEDHRADRARLELGLCEQAVEIYRNRTGHWPEATTWAMELVDAGILEKAPVDPWDQPYGLRFESTDGGTHVPRAYTLGRDGEEGTDDDLPRRTSFAAPP